MINKNAQSKIAFYRSLNALTLVLYLTNCRDVLWCVFFFLLFFYVHSCIFYAQTHFSNF